MERAIQPGKRNAVRAQQDLQPEHDARERGISLHRSGQPEFMGPDSGGGVGGVDHDDVRTDRRNGPGIVICPYHLMIAAGAVLMVAGLALAIGAGLAPCECDDWW